MNQIVLTHHLQKLYVTLIVHGCFPRPQSHGTLVPLLYVNYFHLISKMHVHFSTESSRYTVP